MLANGKSSGRKSSLLLTARYLLCTTSRQTPDDRRPYVVMYDSRSLGFVEKRVYKSCCRMQNHAISRTVARSGCMYVQPYLLRSAQLDARWFTGSIKQRLLAVYIRYALATKGGCDKNKLASFSTLLASLTPDDFSGAVQPVLEKLQKKNPDSILLAVASLVKHVRIDLSAHVGIFLPPLLRQIRSSKEDVRRIAVELMSDFAKRCGDPEVGGRAASYHKGFCLFHTCNEKRKTNYNSFPHRTYSPPGASTHGA